MRVEGTQIVFTEWWDFYEWAHGRYLDILIRPAPALTTGERAEVKKVARELLARLQELLVLNWRQKAAARSALRLAIEGTLDAALPPAYTSAVYLQKCAALFEHVYESYPEWRTRVYAKAA